MARYIGDPKYDPLFWLCAPIILIHIAGMAIWAWLKARLPRRKPQFRCRDCGWALPWDTASLICGPCGRLRASKIKLFCCDMDLTFLEGRAQIHPGWRRTTTDRYCCPACSRIWLYITEWHKDSGSEADWYPQQTNHDDHSWPYLFDGRTRTKVY